jgi:hypothetical protein
MSRRTIGAGIAVLGLAATLAFVTWALDLLPRDRIDSRLRSLIANERGRVFSMSEVTGFDWDYLYVLGPYSNASAIRELADLPRGAQRQISVDEGACLLVFLRGNTIAHYISFNRRYGDFSQVSREDRYSRAHSRFIVPTDQPRNWPKVRWAGAAQQQDQPVGASRRTLF